MSDPVSAHLQWLILQGRSFNTRRARKSVLGLLARSITVPILEATPDDLLVWRCGLTEVVAATIQGYLSHVHEFYRWAIRAKLIDEDPSAGLPSPRSPHRIPRPIRYEDLVLAVSSTTGQVRLWIVLGAWCGLRMCELAGLRGECITLRGPSPSILIAADATKGRRERVVPLSPFVVGELEMAGLPPRGWVFRRLDGKAGPPQPWRVSQIVAETFRALEIIATGHMLRHWGGTEFYETSGHDLRATQEWLGHARISTTEIYTLVRPGRAAEIVARMPVPRFLRAVS